MEDMKRRLLGYHCPRWKELPDVELYVDQVVSYVERHIGLLDIGGEALVISQFTLYGDCRKGRRPGFSDAADPAEAEQFYEHFLARIADCGVKNVQHGRFGADMQVRIFNDGPVTFMLESRGGVGV